MLASNVFAHGTIAAISDTYKAPATSPGYEHQARRVAASSRDVTAELENTTEEIAKPKPPDPRKIAKLLEIVRLISVYHREAHELLALEQPSAVCIECGRTFAGSTVVTVVVVDSVSTTRSAGSFSWRFFGIRP
jgi:hypothetical protein